jgi:hypothetical protein
MSKYIGGIRSNTTSVVRKIANPTSISNCIHCYLFNNPSNLGEDIGSELDDLETVEFANAMQKLNSSDGIITRSSSLKSSTTTSIVFINEFDDTAPIPPEGPIYPKTYSFDINELSVSFWCIIKRKGSSSKFAIGGDYALPVYRQLFILSEDNFINIKINDSTDSEDTISSTEAVINSDMWNHIVVTFNGTNTKLYVNNSEVTLNRSFNNLGFEPILAGSLLYFIGFYISKDEEFASFCIYNKVLSIEEINFLYEIDNTNSTRNNLDRTGIITNSNEVNIRNNTIFSPNSVDISEDVELIVNGPASLNNTLTVTGEAQIDSDLTINAPTQMNGKLTVSTTETDSLTVNNSTTLDGLLNIGGLVNFNVGYYNSSGVVSASNNIVVAIDNAITLTLPTPDEGRFVIVRNLSNDGSITLDCLSSDSFQVGSAITQTQTVGIQSAYVFVGMTTFVGTRYVAVSSI